MKIKIENDFSEGEEYFRFEMSDGPEEATLIRGVAIDLAETFAKIIEWRHRIANHEN
ncbi:hypothetical protein SCBWM1_gp125 [Synechococcus phage S-CBWM1]|uniref:Uncharacterized protein n=1 Tax=Synechococcus phage S-CBWM1 TaxID=2053653 RepID=A0A3G1L3Q5_9CAUD|nr:hypothetical protein HOU61_gp072 [Synechococcus phage S-CBWM1]ATW62809.1 hypothetical protein SCBWM1_gp125 [Synechococcus phage S-CBWM1]